MKRRIFLKTTLAIGALSTLGAAGRSKRAQEYYELRAYRLKPGSKGELLHKYLQTALIPGLNRLGFKNIGVWTEIDAKDPATVFVLVPFRTLGEHADLTEKLRGDKAHGRNGAEYLETSAKQAAFERIDTWLLKAFAAMPKLELPSYSKGRKARIFEMRTYESYSEAKALKKIQMFNEGEVETMREVGLGPIFFGEALAGANLPHLTYMTSAENETLHQQHWADFGKHPTWLKQKSDPQYADTVSKITKWFLIPAAYSQI